MKKIFYLLVSIMMISVVSTLNVFAMPYNPNLYTSVNQVSELLPPDRKHSKVTENAKTRGDFFLSADLTIMNNGDGTIGALAVALAAVPVDEVYITIYLDQWDKEAERWRQVKYYEEEFYSKDYPEGLTTPKVSLTFTDQPSGYYYRLRGAFSMMYNGEFEGFSPVTDGILLN